MMQGLWIETQSPEVQIRPSLHTGANREDFWRSPVSATLANRLLGSSPETGLEEINDNFLEADLNEAAMRRTLARVAERGAVALS